MTARICPGGASDVAGSRLLVPVDDSSTIRQTVEYAVRTALDGGDGYIRFVYIHSPDQTQAATQPDTDEHGPLAAADDLLDRIAVWGEEDAGDSEESLTVETDSIGADSYLFGPEDFAWAIQEVVTAHDIDHIVLDPEYDPGIGTPLLRPLEYELAEYTDATVEQAQIQRQTRRRPLVVGSTPLQVGALFGIAFVFYQVLAGTFAMFDLVTGAISATVVAVGLSRVTFHQDPSGASILRALRLAVYIPYLLYEILKANIAVSKVILDPRMPIEPRMTRVQAAVWGGLPITTLANSITLTPGTLTVRVSGRSLTVHTLIPEAREDLFDGGLERGTRFVFYGRNAVQVPSPEDRGDTAILNPPADETPTDDETDTDGGER